MSRTALSMAVLVATTTLGLAPSASAQEVVDEPMVAQAGGAEALPADYAPPDAVEQTEGPAPPIPPYVDEPPVPAEGGGYCFEGPHPVDSRVEPGVTWDNTPGRHMHGYPPFDLRLFNFQNGCYYFIGDPTDFGYAGQTYSYYGAHPILATYGGGWCFMIGPHHHFWRPWSPLFATVGPWYYWEGPYDPFFWTYWPFYHYYYRQHYPTYYSHGAFFHRHAVAPRITSVPRPMGRGAAWHGAAAGRPLRSGIAPRGGAGAADPLRGGLPARGGVVGPGGTLRGGNVAPGAVRGAPGTFRGSPTTPRAAPGMYRGSPAVPRGGVTAPPAGGATPRGFSPPSRSFSPPSRSFSPSFSAPSRGFSAPSRGFSAPSRGFSAPRSGGGGARFGGGSFGGTGRGRR